jgi:hypothetical protein
MNRNMQWTRILAITIVLSLTASAKAVMTKQIDLVVQKTLLNNELLESTDFEVIDAFWGEALYELLFAEDFSEIVSIRNQIFVRRGGTEPSQYSVVFITSAQKHLKTAFDKIESWETSRRKAWIERNLIILTAQLESPKLLELGLRMIGHRDGTVRYWAVKTVTNPGVIGQLNSETSPDAELSTRIIRQLETTAMNETHPEILSLIAAFAGQVNGPPAKELLIRIVDLRTRAYEEWTVKYELMDAKLLRSIGNEILSPASEQSRPALCCKFAQLYSYVMQRYILGEGILSEITKQQLASVLVEVEQSVLDRLLGRPQSTIKKAVEKILTSRTAEQKDYSALQQEHDSLLGSTARKGDLAAALNFDYGKNPDGTAITSPKKLGPPPEPQPETETTEPADETAEPEPEATEPEAEAAETSE